MANLKHETIHTPTGEEYGDIPDSKATKVKVLCHASDRSAGHPPVWADMPADIYKVCPNMPTLVKVTGATGKGQGIFHLFDGSKADLAAWKATRTKRLPNRAAQGSYQLDPRQAQEAVDPTLSDAARRAWDTRRANASTTTDEADAK